MERLLKLFKKRTQSEINNQKVKIKTKPAWFSNAYYCVKFKGEFDFFYTPLVEWSSYLKRITLFTSSDVIYLHETFKNYSYEMCVNFNKKALEEEKIFQEKIKSGIIKNYEKD